MAITPLRREPSPATALPFKVRTLGRIRRNPLHTTAGTYHGDAMLTVVLAGAGAYLRGGRQRPVVAGMVGLVLPGGEVGLLMADRADAYDHVYCRFAGDEALRIARRVVERHGPAGAEGASQTREGGGGAAFFRHAAWEEIGRVLLRGWPGENITRHDAAQRMTRLDAILAEALTLLEDPPAEDALRPTADRLLAYIDDHIAEPTDLAALAAHFGLSKGHLCRVAQRELGQTLQRRWEQVKIDRAKVLLAEPSLGIGEVARRVGYRQPNYFSNVFRRVTGDSPSGYRERLA